MPTTPQNIMPKTRCVGPIHPRLIARVMKYAIAPTSNNEPPRSSHRVATANSRVIPFGANLPRTQNQSSTVAQNRSAAVGS